MPDHKKCGRSGGNAEQPTSPLVESVIQQREHVRHTQTDSLAALAPPSEQAMPVRHTHSLFRILLTLFLPRRVPVLLQMSRVECGAACLAMIREHEPAG